MSFDSSIIVKHYIHINTASLTQLLILHQNFKQNSNKMFYIYWDNFTGKTRFFDNLYIVQTKQTTPNIMLQFLNLLFNLTTIDILKFVYFYPNKQYQ